MWIAISLGTRNFLGGFPNFPELGEQQNWGLLGPNWIGNGVSWLYLAILGILDCQRAILGTPMLTRGKRFTYPGGAFSRNAMASIDRRSIVLARHIDNKKSRRWGTSPYRGRKSFTPFPQIWFHPRGENTPIGGSGSSISPPGGPLCGQKLWILSEGTNARGVPR